LDAPTLSSTTRAASTSTIEVPAPGEAAPSIVPKIVLVVPTSNSASPALSLRTTAVVSSASPIF
jgi:hypothetical protein